MRSTLLIALALFACRTPPLAEPDDAQAPPDLEAPADQAMRCPAGCAADELCVFLDRGDCSHFICAAAPRSCGDASLCTCLGAGFCAGFAMPNETLTCRPPDPGLPGDVTCQSTLQCV
jgi:hypothetical protein